MSTSNEQRKRINAKPHYKSHSIHVYSDATRPQRDHLHGKDQRDLGGTAAHCANREQISLYFIT